MSKTIASDTAVVFIHIPKTAGTTLGRILAFQYAESETYIFGGPFGEPVETFLAMPAKEKRKLKLIRGHIGYGIQTQLPQPTSCFTMLREPVARTVSYYQYLLRNPEISSAQKILENHLTLAQYLEQTISPAGSDNGQTRFLSLGPDTGMDVPYGSVTRADLKRAQENLRDGFDCVGIMEQFDASLLMLAQQYGWASFWYTPENVNPTKAAHTQLDAATRALICQHNTLDLELYAFAQELVRTRLRAQPAIFHARLRFFKTLNARPALRNLLGRLRHPLR